MTVDADQLLGKIASGKTLKDDELKEIVELLSGDFLGVEGGELTLDEVYELLLVLGKAKAVSERRVLEKYLDCQEPQTVSLVLDILCGEWGFTEEYTEYLLNFSLGQSWDAEGDVQVVAIKLLGEHLHRNAPKMRGTKGGKGALTDAQKKRCGEIFSLLDQHFRDPDMDSIIRKTAYYSLCRAAGREWEQIPSEFARLNLEPGSPDVDWGVIEACQALSSSSSRGESA
ncbi:MAG: hypothetical protein IT290_08025 [Deltaproteobacteria bacterium]|nr:hypothetical protein [Deltaproteobacteria bacterium]